MSNTYDLGNVIRLSVVFTQLGGAPIDPTAVQLNVRPYGGDIQTFTYALNQITRTGVGAYYCDFTPTTPGQYFYRFSGTGAAVAAGDGQFNVTDSNAIDPNPFPAPCC